MKLFLRFIPFQLTICLVLGIFFGYYIHFKASYIVWLLCAEVLVFTYVYYKSNINLYQNRSFKILFFLITVTLGIAVEAQKSDDKKDYFNRHQDFSLASENISIIKILKVLKPSSYSNKYEAEVVQYNGSATSGKILLNASKDKIDSVFNVDQLLSVNAVFTKVTAPKNPYDFNYKEYLEKQQINYQLFVEGTNCLNVGITNRSINGLAADFRNEINKALENYNFKDNELAVINALLLGQRQSVSTDLMENYSNAGAIHILAVSGLHIGILLLILTFLFKPLNYLKKGKFIALICIVICLWVYAIIAGLSASVVRAVTMFTAVAIAMYSNKPTNIYHTLISSMFFLLLIHPRFVFDVGFQLSYLAVFAIVWIQPKIYNLFQPKIWIVDKVWQLFTVSIAAQIGVLPLSLFYFHQFPGLFFISNLVIIPFLGVILTTGIVVISLALLNILPQKIGDVYIFIIEKMNGFVSWIAHQEAFIVNDISFSLGLLLVSYLLIVTFFKWTEKSTFKRFSVLLVAVMLFQGVIIFEKYKRQTSKELIVFQKTKETIIGNRKGNDFEVFSSNKKMSKKDNPIKNYLVGTGVRNAHFNVNKAYLSVFNNSKIVIVDSLGIYNFKGINNPIVLLTNSPKINLQRLINILKPSEIIADGSNYKSYSKHWQQTSLKNKTPFYNTLQNGAYILK